MKNPLVLYIRMNKNKTATIHFVDGSFQTIMADQILNVMEDNRNLKLA